MRRTQALKRAQALLQQRQQQMTQHVTLHKNGQVEILNTDEFTKLIPYKQQDAPKINEYLREEYPVKIIIGPFGSGKSSAVMRNAILRDAIEMPRCDDGIRRSRIAIVRNTQGELVSTTLATWNFWMNGLPEPKRNKKPVFTLAYEFNDEKGPIQLEVLWIALDRDGDIGKLASLELTSAFFNELKFIPKSIFNMMQDRIKRFPAKIEYIKQFDKLYGHLEKDERNEFYMRWLPYPSKIYADTNAPRAGHWIEELDINPIKGTRVYHQPPALIKNEDKKWQINAEADNILHVGSQYYLDMIPRGDEYVRVYAQGNYGTVVAGKPVYMSYNDDLHSVDDLTINPLETIYFGIDYGKICPAFIMAQFVNNQIRFIKEFIGDDMAVKQLYLHSVLPFLNKYCKGMTVEAVGDPANSLDGMEQLAECGFEAKKARTNNVEPRICSVDNRLNLLEQGKPKIVISRAGCPKLRDGFIGEYHYKELKVIGEDRFEEKPYKNHPYSDIHDAAQYVVMLIVDEEQLQMYENEMPQSFNKYDEDDASAVTGY